MTAVRTLLARGVRDLRVRRYPVAADARRDGRGPYPLVWTDLPGGTGLDERGVVVAVGPAGERYPNPVSMCLYALGEHSRALAVPGPDRERFASFLTQANWLRAHQDSAGGWRYPVPVPRYGVTPGWYSGMAQGMAASTLLRAHDLTGERSFLDAADGAVDLLLRPVSRGGCADHDRLGRPFLEECPADPPSRVLNGALFALFGLVEHQSRRGGQADLLAADRLAEELGGFDLGWWSRYDLRWSWPASANYHALHVSLLRAAAALTGLSVFARTADRWSRQLRDPRCQLRARLVKATRVWQHRHG
ncbi:D-glucuronyl C5-epimerase family protein [Micromonospora coerulea]|uniref:D-glucuronyl C5-epimerase family protein n=1 Tax=Micromonospora coerulea TaxID=47856 RepID=UPI0019067F97|nr:D-glucuronyl C5-epimerase family protein [Micromonospora veneta]